MAPTRTRTSHTAAKQPKRPPNAFILFRQWVMKQPFFPTGVKSMPDVSRYVGHLWAALSPEDKLYWAAEAEAAKAAHYARYPDYKYRPRTQTQKAEEKQAAAAAKKAEKEQKAAERKAAKKKAAEKKAAEKEAVVKGKARSSSRHTRSATAEVEAGPVASCSTAGGMYELPQWLDTSTLASGSRSHESPTLSSAIVAEGPAQVAERNLFITNLELPFVYYGHLPPPLPTAPARPSLGMVLPQPSCPSATTSAGIAAGSSSVWRPDVMLEADEVFNFWPAEPLTPGASANLDECLHAPTSFQQSTPQDEFVSVDDYFNLDNVAIDPELEEILGALTSPQQHDLGTGLASSSPPPTPTDGLFAEAVATTPATSASPSHPSPSAGPSMGSLLAELYGPLSDVDLDFSTSFGGWVWPQ